MSNFTWSKILAKQTEIVGETLVHEIVPHHVIATPQGTGLTAPLSERHIPLYEQ